MGLSTDCSCRALLMIVAFGFVSMATCVDVRAFRGENATLVCQGKSTTETIDWFSVSRGHRIIRGTTTNKEYPRFASVGNHSSGEYNLHIADLRDEDAGIYYCSNARRYPLQKLRILSKVLAVRGENVTLVCQENSTTGRIDWYHLGDLYARGEKISPNKTRATSVGDYAAWEYNLQICDLRDEDAGEYYCADPVGSNYLSQSLRIIDPISADHVMSRVSVSGNGLSLSVTAFEIQILPTLTLLKLGSVESSSIVAARVARRTHEGTYIVTWTYAESNMAPGVYNYSAAIFPGSYRDVYSAEITQQDKVTTTTIPQQSIPKEQCSTYTTTALCVAIGMFMLAFIHTAIVHVYSFGRVVINKQTPEMLMIYLLFWPFGCFMYVLCRNNLRQRCGRHCLALIPVVGAVTIIFMNSKRNTPANFEDSPDHPSENIPLETVTKC